MSTVKRGPIPRTTGMYPAVSVWPVWRVVYDRANLPEGRWVALAPGEPVEVMDRDGYFATHAEALAYALDQIETR